MTATSRIVLDSWAWLELFSGSEKGRKVDKAIANATETYTSIVTLAEVVSTSARRERPTDDKTTVIRSQSKVVPASSDDAIVAGLLHAETKQRVPNFSLADAFVLQLARKLGARVVTGDPDLRGLAKSELVELVG